MTFAVLLNKFAAEKHPPRKAQDKREALFARFAKLIGHDDPERVTKADIRAWKEHRQTVGVTPRGKAPRPASPKTINDDIGMFRAVFSWALDNGLLSLAANPFARMGVRYVKGANKPDPFTDDEAATILKAARREHGFLRWLLWLLAFTGARIEEVCGASKEDVRRKAGVVVLDIRARRVGRNDDGLKNSESQRMVPLHSAIIAEGFMDYVAALPAGSALFPDLRIRKRGYGRRGESATQRHSRWLRLKVGITDARKAPAHSWRHRMEDELRRARVLPEAADAITGHKNPGNSGAGYGRGFRGMPDELAKEIEKLPSPLGARSSTPGHFESSPL